MLGCRRSSTYSSLLKSDTANEEEPSSRPPDLAGGDCRLDSPAGPGAGEWLPSPGRRDRYSRVPMNEGPRSVLAAFGVACGGGCAPIFSELKLLTLSSSSTNPMCLSLGMSSSDTAHPASQLRIPKTKGTYRAWLQDRGPASACPY